PGEEGRGREAADAGRSVPGDERADAGRLPLADLDQLAAREVERTAPPPPAQSRLEAPLLLEPAHRAGVGPVEGAGQRQHASAGEDRAGRCHFRPGPCNSCRRVARWSADSPPGPDPRNGSRFALDTMAAAGPESCRTDDTRGEHDATPTTSECPLP